MLLFSARAHAESWKDASDSVFVADGPPNRIITLAPALAEIVAAVTTDAQKKLIGVSDYSNFPEWVRAVPSVGSFQKSNAETVVSLRPDLVIATKDGNSPDQVAQLKRMKLRVLVVRTGKVSEWLESIAWISKAVGNVQAGEQTVHALSARLSVLDERARLRRKQGKSDPRALILLGVDPWITIGPGSLLFEALTRIGIDPSVKGSSPTSAYPKFSREAIWATHWDAVLVLGQDVEQALPATDRARFLKQGARVLAVSGDELLRPAMRFVDGLEKLQRTLFDAPAVQH